MGSPRGGRQLWRRPGTSEAGARLHGCDVGSRQTPQPRERPTALARQRGRDPGAAVSPNVLRFLSIFQTKANWRVRLINFGGAGGIRPSRGPGSGREAEARWGARADAHVKCPSPSVAPGLARVDTFPGLRGFQAPGIRSQTGSGVGLQPTLQTWRAGWREGAGSRRPARSGQRLKPKVKSESLRLAGSCSGFPAVSPLHR